MTITSAPTEWKAPEWHPDFGDASSELEMLQAFASRLLAVSPRTVLTLDAPEPGLLYVRGELPDARIFEAYAVVSTKCPRTYRLGIFLNPDTATEDERYFESIDETIGFLTTK